MDGSKGVNVNPASLFFSSAERDARGRFICAQCPESSDALRGVLGKTYM